MTSVMLDRLSGPLMASGGSSSPPPLCRVLALGHFYVQSQPEASACLSEVICFLGVSHSADSGGQLGASLACATPRVWLSHANNPFVVSSDSPVWPELPVWNFWLRHLKRCIFMMQFVQGSIFDSSQSLLPGRSRTRRLNPGTNVALQQRARQNEQSSLKKKKMSPCH